MGSVIEATYQLHIDWDNDGSFATSGDNVTADLQLPAIIERGYASPLARMPSVGRATFVLNNQAQTYSPPLDSGVVPWRPVRFQMVYDSTTVVLFRGFIEAIRPAAGAYRQRNAVIECVDAMALLDIFEGRIAIQVNAYADDIISDVVDDVYSPPATNYQAGINQFPTSGEHWTINQALAQVGTGQAAVQENARAAQKIQDACVADWGRFFISKAGAPTFFNRHQMPLYTSTALTLDDNMQELAYEKRVSDVYNWVEVTYLPRAVSEGNEVLGRFAPEKAARIGPLETDTFVINYRDPINQAIAIGGISVLSPVNGTDYAVTDDELGEGADISANLNISFTAYADKAEIEIENTDASDDAYIQFLQVRGKAVRSREPETVVAADNTSINAYGQRKLPVKAPLMANNAQAQALASYLLDVYKGPQHIVDEVRILANKSDTFMKAVRDLELMDRVSITETQTGLSAFVGHIYRMRHVIASKREHWLSFALETPYDVGGTPFILGDTLDSGHILIY